MRGGIRWGSELQRFPSKLFQSLEEVEEEVHLCDLERLESEFRRTFSGQ